MFRSKKFTRFVGAAIALGLASGWAGCATTVPTLQKKFTRKKKTPAHIPSVIYTDKGPYQKQFSNDYYYKTHFTMWQTWQDDLLNQLGGNSKKVSRAAEEALGHLTDMRNYLVPEKQAELDPELKSLTDLVDKIRDGSALRAREGAIRVELERIRRTVAGRFYYEKVKGSILPDKVDLGDAAAPSAPAADPAS